MNLTNPYWSPPLLLKSQRGKTGFENHLGFFFKQVHPDIQTAGWNFGENPGYGRRELVLSGGERPQYYAVTNTLPASGGVPKYNPRDPIYKMKRSDYTIKKV